MTPAPDTELEGLVREAERRGMLKRDPELGALIGEAQRRGMLGHASPPARPLQAQAAPAAPSLSAPPPRSPYDRPPARIGPPPGITPRKAGGFQWVASLSNAYSGWLNELARQGKQVPQITKDPAGHFAALPGALKKAFLEGARRFGPEAVTPEHLRIAFGAERGKADRTLYNTLAVLDYASAIMTDPTNMAMGPVTKAAGAALKGAAKVTGVTRAGKGLIEGGKAEIALQNATALAERRAKDLALTPRRSSQWQKRAILYGQARAGEGAAEAVVQGQRGTGKLGAVLANTGKYTGKAPGVVGRVAGALTPNPVKTLTTLERDARNQLAQESALWLKRYEAGVSGVKGAILTRPSSVVADTMGNLGAVEVELTRQGVTKGAFFGGSKAAMQEARAFGAGQAVGDAAELHRHAPHVLGTLAQQAQQRATGPLSRALADNPLLRTRSDLDRAMKIALFKALKPKLGAAKAAERVRVALFDYSDRPALLQLADRWGLSIFNGFPLAGTKSFVETLIHRPDLVARYPRLQQQLFQEFPGSWEAYQQLPAWRRHVFTYPAGQDEEGAQRFRDFGRVSPWSVPFGLAQAGGRLLRHEEQAPPTMQDVVGQTVLSSLFRAQEKAAKMTGASPEEKNWKIVTETLLNALPILRDAAKLKDAAAGLTGTDYKLARPKAAEDARLEVMAGIATERGQTRAQKAEAAGPAMQGRAAVAAAYFRQVDADLKSGKLAREYDAYARRFRSVNNLDELTRAVNDAKKRFTEMMLSPDNVVGGKLTPDGAQNIRESYLRFRALSARLVELVGGTSAPP